MANEEHLAILKEAIAKNDISIWNRWRNDNPDVRPNLFKANLSETNLSEADLSEVKLLRANLSKANLFGANLSGADLRETMLDEAKLYKADLRGANLSEADLYGADLHEADLNAADLNTANVGVANLRKANLCKANLYMANLSKSDLTESILSLADLSLADLHKADLSGVDLSDANLYMANLYMTNLYMANLSDANLRGASLIQTNFNSATLKGCSIYGISAWDIQLEGAVQKDLNIAPNGQSPITVDNLKIAQFIYLLLNNAEIRNVIDTITGKAVLILGRFAPERKVVLDAIREDLRSRGFLPILFDFEKPSSRDLTETVVTLAHLSRFVIADLTNPSSIPHELMSFTRDLPSVPVQPIILKEHRPYAMFLNHFERYPWMLPVHEYESQETLIAEIAEKVIQPAQDKAEAMKPKPF